MLVEGGGAQLDLLYCLSPMLHSGLSRLGLHLFYFHSRYDCDYANDCEHVANHDDPAVHDTSNDRVISVCSAIVREQTAKYTCYAAFRTYIPEHGECQDRVGEEGGGRRGGRVDVQRAPGNGTVAALKLRSGGQQVKFCIGSK